MIERKTYGTATEESEARHRRMLDKSFEETAKARALIDKAWDKCIGCRTVWRFKPDTFCHPMPGGRAMRCWAIETRRELKEAINGKDRPDRRKAGTSD